VKVLEQSAIYGDLIQTYQSTTYWNLVTNHEVLILLGQGSVWTAFGKQFVLGAFPNTE
jgi:hypothetical protein